MVSKFVLPLFGGSPAVWTTSMLFFQVFLLLGYLYSHLTIQRIKSKVQVALHIGLLILALPLLLLPTGFRQVPAFVEGGSSVIALLYLLAISIGFPFFIASASSPLLQYWYTQTRQRQARDPYFLYVSSNIGSFCALLAYPALIEPMFRLQEQRFIWLLLYGLLILLFSFCGLAAWPRGRNPMVVDSMQEEQGASNPAYEDEKPSLKRRLHWLLLTFIPSSLMLGVTSHLTTDIASIPLLWVIPLGIYLLTFTLVFGRRRIIPETVMIRVFPISALVVVFIMLTEIDQPLWLIFLAFLLFFFTSAMICHGRLAADRPNVRYLSIFYLYVAVGGMSGGLFNALLAPFLFKRVTELPLVLILSCMFFKKIKLPRIASSGKKWLYWLLPLSPGILATILATWVPQFTLEPYQLWMIVIFGVPLFLSYLFVNQPLRYGLALGAIMLGSTFYTAIHGKILYRERNFFGCLQVNFDPRGPYHKLFHGTTIHGMQFITGAKGNEPLAYFHRLGPFGQVFSAYNGNAANTSVGVIGLGVGSMLAYATMDQNWTFYEIDPAVIRVARDPRFFTYMQNCKARQVRIIPGDARLQIQKAPDGAYGLLVIDAFNSDAIPVHLITKEAFQLYLRKLADQGILAMNISNKNLDLTQVIADLAGELGVYCLQQRDSSDDFNNPAIQGKFNSQWAVMAHHTEVLAKLMMDPRWHRIPKKSGNRVWSDDFSNILGILRWR